MKLTNEERDAIAFFGLQYAKSEELEAGWFCYTNRPHEEPLNNYPGSSCESLDDVVRWYREAQKKECSEEQQLSNIVMHLLFGDIDEMTLAVLGQIAPTQKELDELDREQHIRLQCAATVQAWIENRLHFNGRLFDKDKDNPKYLLRRN